MKSELKVNYEELYNTAPCGYVCFNCDGKIIEVNNRFLDFVGYSREEIINKKSIPNFLTKAGKIQYDSSFQVILKLQGSVEEFSFSLLKKDGTRIPVLINSVEVKNEQEECIYIQSTIFDITQRKRYEDLLIASKKNLDGTLKELEQLTYIATHDLKSPILDIEGHFDYLRDKLPPADEFAQESVGYIDEAINQFNTTIQGLTEAIKLRSADSSKDPVNLNHVFDRILPKLESKIKDIKGELNTQLIPNTQILGNEIFVESVLQNIIGNAVKYHSKNRLLNIQIQSKIVEEFICLSITDNGEGIDINTHKDRLFRMFTRFNDTTKGTGMGLYMSKKMIEQMHGKITIESEPNVGTTFKVYFRRITE